MQKALLILGFLLYPFYALPFVFKLVFKNETVGYILLSLFLAYLSYLMIPYDTMDLTRHYEGYNLALNSNFEDLYFIYNRAANYGFLVYMWFISQIGLAKEFVPFSVTFITYMLFLLILKDIIKTDINIKQNNISSTKLILLGCFFILNIISFVETASGLRTPFAYSIFIYAIYKFLKNKNYFIFLVLSILACVIHFSVSIVFLLFIMSYCIRCFKCSKLFFYFGVFILVGGLSKDIFFYIVSLLEPFLREAGLYFPAYMDANGAWGAGFYEQKNITTIVYEKLMRPLPFYVAGIYFVYTKKYFENYLAHFLLILFFVIAIFSVSITFYARYYYFFTILFVYFLLIEIKYKKITKFKKVYIYAFIASLVIYDIGGLYKYRDIYIRSWAKTLIVPAPIMLLKSVEPHEYIIRLGG